MAHRIEIGFKKGIRDALGEKTRRRIIENLHFPVDEVKTIDVYTIDGRLSLQDLKKAAAGPLSDPVIQHFAIDSGLADRFDWMIEVGFRPGVTDNVGKDRPGGHRPAAGTGSGGSAAGLYVPSIPDQRSHPEERRREDRLQPAGQRSHRTV